MNKQDNKIRKKRTSAKKTSKTVQTDEETFFTDIICDIYIGKKAGNTVRDAIRKARKSVTIIAPFLSGKMISEEIFNSLNKDIQVNIVSKDSEKIYPILKKNMFSKHSLSIFEKWFFLLGKLLLIASYTILVTAAIEVFSSFILNVSFLKNVIPLSRGNFLAATIVLAILIFFLQKIVTNSLFFYSIRENLKLHILDSNYPLHSKIYIIDNKVAFLGSLNCTDTGFILNHETCIKTSDKSMIKHLNAVYGDLLKVRAVPLSELKSKIKSARY